MENEIKISERDLEEKIRIERRKEHEEITNALVNMLKTVNLGKDGKIHILQDYDLSILLCGGEPE